MPARPPKQLLLVFLGLIGAEAAPPLLHSARVPTPSPTPDPCQWDALVHNNGWNFGDVGGDSKTDYFRWSIADMVEVNMHVADMRQLNFDRASFQLAFGPAAGIVSFVCAVLSTKDDAGSGFGVSGFGGGGMTVRTACASPCKLVTTRLLRALRDPRFAARVGTRMRGQRVKPRLRVTSVRVIVPPPHVNGRGGGGTLAAPATSFPAVLRASGQQTWAFGAAANLLLPTGHWLTPATQLQWVLFDMGQPRRVDRVTLRLWGTRGGIKTAFLQGGSTAGRVHTVAKIAVPAASSRAITITVRRSHEQRVAQARQAARAKRSPARGTTAAALPAPPAMRYFRLFVSENWGATWGMGFDQIVFHCADGGNADCSSGGDSGSGFTFTIAMMSAMAAASILVVSGMQLQRRSAQHGLDVTHSNDFELGGRTATTPYAPLPAAQPPTATQ